MLFPGELIKRRRRLEPTSERDKDVGEDEEDEGMSAFESIARCCIWASFVAALLVVLNYWLERGIVLLK